jgi:hypothetical protein
MFRSNTLPSSFTLNMKALFLKSNDELLADYGRHVPEDTAVIFTATAMKTSNLTDCGQYEYKLAELQYTSL